MVKFKAKFNWLIVLPLFLLLTCEELNQSLPDLLVDEDVQQRVNETVQVHQGHHLLKDIFLLFKEPPCHEDHTVGPDADQEGECDGSHYNGHSSLTSELVFFKIWLNLLKIAIETHKQYDL